MKYDGMRYYNSCRYIFGQIYFNIIVYVKNGYNLLHIETVITIIQDTTQTCKFQYRLEQYELDL